MSSDRIECFCKFGSSKITSELSPIGQKSQKNLQMKVFWIVRVDDDPNQRLWNVNLDVQIMVVGLLSLYGSDPLPWVFHIKKLVHHEIHDGHEVHHGVHHGVHQGVRDHYLA